MKFNSFLYRRNVIRNVRRLADYCVFYLFFAGGTMYSVAELWYVYTFDLFTRRRPSIKRSEDQSWSLWKYIGSFSSTKADDSEHSVDQYNENPGIVGRYRLYPHVPWKGFKSRTAALAYWKSNCDTCFQENVLYLAKARSSHDGQKYLCSVWSFILVGSPAGAPANWQSCDISSSSHNWKPINVPGHWQLQEFDIPMYTNTTYPFPCDPPRVCRNGEWDITMTDVSIMSSKNTTPSIHPNEPGTNSTGLYRTKIILPMDWYNRLSTHRVILVFDGVDSCFHVWLEGVYVGYGQDFALPSEFDITDILHLHGKKSSQGDHVVEYDLAIQVMRWCDGSYIEDQDKWWLSGIYRDVSLVMKPSLSIYDYEFNGDIVTSDGISTGIVTLNILIAGIPENDRLFVRAELWNVDEDFTSPCLVLIGAVNLNEFVVDPMIYEADMDMKSPQQTGRAILTGKIDNPHLWSSETPHLYQLVITLHSFYNEASKGVHHLDIESCRVGLRSVSFNRQDNLLCLNDSPLIIAGVNRTEFEPSHGRTLNEFHIRQDISMMKQYNFNSVRSAHYPPNHRFLELCDEAGLYVIDEANIESHGLQTAGQPVGYLSYKMEWRSALLSRVVRMYERDKNHCSIIGWSLGNESGYGPTHQLMHNWLHKRDQRRFVQYESGGARSRATDIICPMYMRPYWCKEQSIQDTNRRPVILCEYAHAMGNSGGCFAEYWKHFHDPDIPRMQGGFVWDLIDQGILLESNQHGDKRIGYGYGGDFGDEPNSGNFCCNGLFGPDRSPHPSAFEVKICQSPIQVSIVPSVDDDMIYLDIRNYRQFIDFSDFEILFRLSSSISSSNQMNSYADINMYQYPFRPMDNTLIPLSNIFSVFEPFDDSKLASKGKSSSLLALLKILDTSMENLCYLSDLWIEVLVRTKHATPWIPAGHEVYRCSVNDPCIFEFINNKYKLPRIQYEISRNDNRSITVTEEEDYLVVSWSIKAVMRISLQTGNIFDWHSSRGEELLRDLTNCLYRAPTDNDKGGLLLSYANQWDACGLRYLNTSKNSVKILSNFALPSGNVEIKISKVLAPSVQVDLPQSYSVITTYTCYVDGSVKISSIIHLPHHSPPLPRCGLYFSMPSKYDYVSWYGLGPYEAYDDRKECVYQGKFNDRVENLHTPYIAPQENGRRADPKLICLRDSLQGNGLLIVTNIDKDLMREDPTGWGFNASFYSLDDLCDKTHDFELQSHGNIYVNIDCKSMGVGGYDSWTPNVESEYLIDDIDKPIEMSVLLKPINHGQSKSLIYNQIKIGKYKSAQLA